MDDKAPAQALFWCAGMYASGSTWAYNVMRGIAAASLPVTCGFVATPNDLAGLAASDGAMVVKSHDLAGDVASLLLDRAPRIVATIRDPRDAVTSLMKYQHYPFAMALDTIARSAAFIATLADHPRTLLLRFETGFTEAPDTLDRIAAHLGLNLPPLTRDTLFAASARAAVEARIASLDTQPDAVRDPRSGDIFDPKTQWHRHHAGRTGEIGRWRAMLSPAQIAAIQTEMAPFMARFEYPPLIQPIYSFGGFDPFRAARGQ